MADYLLQFFTPEEFANAKGIMSETSSILDSLSDSDMSNSVQSGVEPRSSGTDSCDKQVAASQRRKRIVTYKTPDYSNVKPKVCFGKNKDAPKSRSGAKKESDLSSSSDSVKELRKQSGKTTDPPESRSEAKKETMADYLLQFFTPEEFANAKGIMSETSSILDSLSDSDMSNSVQSGVEPRSSGTDSCDKQVAASQRRKRIVTYKTPDYSNVKPKVCFGKNSDPLKSRSGAKKESDLSSSSDSVKELRTDERTSDVSRRRKQKPTADKSTQTPADTNESASGREPQPSNWPVGGSSEHITCRCRCSHCGRPEADVNCEPAVQAELQPCVTACTPPRRFDSGRVPPNKKKGRSFRVRGHTQTISSTYDSLIQAFRISEDMKQTCNRILELSRGPD